MQSSHTLDQLDIAFDDTTTPSLDQITPLPVPWSCAMVTTDGSTLRTTSGMPPVAACALGAITGAGAERACGPRPNVQPVRAAASKAATGSARSAGRRRRGRPVSRWWSHAAAIVRLLSDGARRGPVPRKERSHLVTAIIGMLAASSSFRASDLVEVVVDEADGHGALPYGRGHPFDGTAAHVAGGEHSGAAGLESQRSAVRLL
jgi:hypothetical protein